MNSRLKIFLFVILVFNLSVECSAQKSSIYGRVIDKKTGETLIGVSIVVEGTAIGSTTDIDGKFQIKNLDAGTYSIVISYVSYASQIIKDIPLTAGKNYQVDITMLQSSQELKTVEINAAANRQSTSTLLTTIRNASTISDGISQDIIKRTPDKNTGEVLKRVSGTSVQDNKFVIVRGLNDRYNYTMINGMPFSSTEPDRKAVAFDIFPAPLIDNIIISKTATPDLPGEFAGGIIQLNTRDIPEENSYSISIGSGVNSQTTFKEFYHGEKGSTDWLGFDNGSRKMPDISISSDSVRNLDLASRVELSKQFPNNWKIYEDTHAAMNYTLQGTYVRNFKSLGKETGVIAGLTYNNSRKLKEIERENFLGLSDTGSTAGEYRYHDLQYTTNVLIGGILNFAVKLNGNNKISLKNTWTQNADDKTTLREGIRPKEGSLLKASSLEYISTHLISSQLQGDHYLEKSKIKIQWGLSASNVYRNTPDLRKLGYNNNPEGEDTTIFYAVIPFTPSPQNAGKVYSTTNENVFNEKADITFPIPFLKGKQEFKTGTLIQQKIRNFQARDFGFKIANSSLFNYNNFLLPQDSIFLPEMISDSGLVIDEITNPYDKYHAEVHLVCFYAMLDNTLTKDLRLLWGMRYENFHQTLITRDPNDKRFVVDRSEPDWMPAANLIWSVAEKINIRLSASRTVARPEFREIALLNIYDFNTEANLAGNPELKRGKIENFDTRFEFYPAVGQVISVTGFYKNFIDPIEQVVSFQGSSRVYSFQNVNNAKNYGIEFEFRLKPTWWMKNNEESLFNSFTVFSNFALIHSRVDLGNVLGISDSVRPLQGQSPYVLNAGIQFMDDKTGTGITAVFNQVGDRIYSVGGDNYFNIIEQHNPSLDLQISKRLFKTAEIKFTVNDVFNKKHIFYWDVNDNNKYEEQTDKYIDTFKYGSGFSLSFSYKF